jgi:hypothetical protein
MRRTNGLRGRFPPRASELKRGRPSRPRTPLDQSTGLAESPIRHYARLLLKQLDEGGQTIADYSEALHEAEDALTREMERSDMTLIKAFELIRLAQAEYLESPLAASQFLVTSCRLVQGRVLPGRARILENTRVLRSGSPLMCFCPIAQMRQPKARGRSDATLPKSPAQAQKRNNSALVFEINSAKVWHVKSATYDLGENRNNFSC